MSKILDKIEMAIVWDQRYDHESDYYFNTADVCLVELTYGERLWITNLGEYEYPTQ